MKFGQILVCCMINISNMLLTEHWRLETKSRPFYGFIKMTIERDLAIFDSWQLPFLIAPYPSFQNMKHWNLDILAHWIIGIDSYIEKDMELSPSHPNCLTDSWKLLLLFLYINWPSLVTWWVVIQIIYLKMHPASCTNTHHDVLDLVNHRDV